VYERGSMALNNCGASAVRNGSFAEDIGWIMDALMCGVGVGLRVFTNDFLRSILYIPPEKFSFDVENKIIFTIEDSREGWVKSVIMLLKSYNREYNEHNRAFIFDYSKIRKFGEPIKGFGGTASGPDPLIILHDRIRASMVAFIGGKHDSIRFIADIANSVGACIIAGNIRRSAEQICGSLHDDTFLNLKNYKLNPEREEIGWMSNNTVGLEHVNDFLKLDNIIENICNNGEPGLLNLLNLRKYERYGHIGRPDSAIMANPCLHEDTTVLEHTKGSMHIKHLRRGDVIWSKEGWTKIIAVYDKGIKDVNKYKTTTGCISLTDNHEIINDGVKIQIKNTNYLERLRGYSLSEYFTFNQLDSSDIIDGLVLGDGSNKKGCLYRYLNIGNKDQDYFNSEVSDFIGRKLDTKLYQTFSSLTQEDLPRMWERQVPDKFRYASSSKTLGFLRGIYSANGTVIFSKGGLRIALKSTSKKLIEQVQVMLSSVGIVSYFTTNKSKKVKFNNGGYQCKESYDLNITSEDIVQFRNYIGFIQKYKIIKLNKAVRTYKFNTKGKNKYKIIDKVALGKCQVYDITVDNKSHTFWANGFDVSNCGEIGLEDKELCNLVELFPVKAKSKKEWLRMCELGTMYATSVSLLPTHDEQTNAVIARNRRIGLSICGVSDWFDKWGAFKIVRFMRDGYSHIKETAKFLNEQAGVPTPIRITTVKPSGTVSQLVGVSPGMHFPIHTYAIRRMRISEISPVLPILQQACIPVEDDVYVKGNTKVIEYPIYTGTTRPVSQVSAWEQFSLLALLQREWSDNMVSCTINFKESEKTDLSRMLAHFIPLIKSVSMLPFKDNVYQQKPYEGISKDEYEKRVSRLKKIDWSSFEGSDGKDSKYCSNDSCEI
jgi:intein/homing endonuclease